ncbi:hypothetical protein ACOSP7_014442 [Xanthoceras sorbifolium]
MCIRNCVGTDVLVVEIGKCVLRIDTTKVGQGEDLSAEAPIPCSVDMLTDEVQLVGKHEVHVSVEEMINKSPDTNTSSKRARREVEEQLPIERRAAVERFKSKLMNSTNPSNWMGGGSGRRKLKIEKGDIMMKDVPVQNKVAGEKNKKNVLRDISNLTRDKGDIKDSVGGGVSGANKSSKYLNQGNVKALVANWKGRGPNFMLRKPSSNWKENYGIGNRVEKPVEFSEQMSEAEALLVDTELRMRLLKRYSRLLMFRIIVVLRWLLPSLRRHFWLCPS